MRNVLIGYFGLMALANVFLATFETKDKLSKASDRRSAAFISMWLNLAFLAGVVVWL